MTDEEANALSDCGYGCYIIGGPWIAENPHCPVHSKDPYFRAAQDEQEPKHD